MDLSGCESREASSEWANQVAELLAQRPDHSAVTVINSAVEQFRKEKFQLAILGKAKRGKSTLINALLGKNSGATKGNIPFYPTKERHAFKFQYDPTANNNTGRITVTLDQRASTLDLTPKQRAEGAHFDHFGVANLRAGGKFVIVYFDDLTYIARRSAGYRPVFHKQEVVKVPYPPGGRKY